MEQLFDLEFLKKALPALVIINIVLSGLSGLLGAIKDKTESQLDNKIAAIVSVLAGYLQKGLDFLGYNPKHK